MKSEAREQGGKASGKGRAWENWLWLILGSLYILGGVALPLCLWIEFDATESLHFYVARYPHMIVYPLIFLWAILLLLKKPLQYIFRQGLVTRKLLIQTSVIISLILIAALFFEVTAGNQMVFEFSAGYQKEKALKDRINGIIEQSAPAKGQGAQAATTLDQQRSELSTLLSLRNPLVHRSVSFWFYLLSFVILIAVMCFAIFSIKWSNAIKDDAARMDYIRNVSFAGLLLVLWFPFRLYYLSQTVHPLFLQNLPFRPEEGFLFMFAGVFFFFVCERLWHSHSSTFQVIGCVGIPLGMAMVTFFRPKWLETMFGLDGNYRQWGMWVLFMVVVYFIFKKPKATPSEPADQADRAQPSA